MVRIFIVWNVYFSEAINREGRRLDHWEAVPSGPWLPARLYPKKRYRQISRILAGPLDLLCLNRHLGPIAGVFFLVSRMKERGSSEKGLSPSLVFLSWICSPHRLKMSKNLQPISMSEILLSFISRYMARNFGASITERAISSPVPDAINRQ